MKEILLNDILHFSNEEISKVKIKLNVWNGWSSPLDEYKNDPDVIDNDWFLYRPKNGKYYFYEGEIALNFIPLGNDSWLLTSIKTINKRLNISDGIAYDATEVKKYKIFLEELSLNFIKVCVVQ